MISTAKVLSAYLIAQSIFTAVSDGSTWPLYRSSLPDDDDVEDNVGTIYDTTGLKDGRIMSSGEVLFHRGIQVRARALDYDIGLAKLVSVASLFEAVHNVEVVVDSVTYTIKSITQTSDVLPLGVEEETKRRKFFSVNFLITIKEE